MKSNQNLDERLQLLNRELSNRDSCVQSVMKRIDDSVDCCDTKPSVKRRFKAPFISTGIGIAASIAVAVCFWSLQPKSLYAEAVAALKRVQSIHLTGKASNVVRQWPLEDQSREEKRETFDIEAWYWKDSHGTDRSYEKAGPVTQTRTGKQYAEYQSDQDLLFQSERKVQDNIDRVSSIAEMISSFEKQGGKVEELGVSEENGKILRGFRLNRNGIEEFWIEANSKLPVRVSRKSFDTQKIEFECSLNYDQPIPPEIATYSPPVAKIVRKESDGDALYAEHVRKLQHELERNADRIVVVPRKEAISFGYQSNRSTPDGKRLVISLDNRHGLMTMQSFLSLHVDAHTEAHLWRVPRDLQTLEFPRADLVVEKETPWREWTSAALETLQLEFYDVEEERTHWIATYDGRKLKPWKEVTPPVASPNKDLIMGAGHLYRPATIQDLFQDFNRDQNNDFNGAHPIIIDETGLPTPRVWQRSEYPTFAEFSKAVNYEQYYVATDSPWFFGKGSLEMARKWYQENLGITFREEKRKVTIHVIRRKDPVSKTALSDDAATTRKETSEVVHDTDVPPLPKVIEFGEVFEVSLMQDDPRLGDFMIDIDKNKLFGVEAIKIEAPHSERFLRLREKAIAQGIDCYCEVNKSFAGLMGIDMVGIPVKEGDWNPDYFTLEQLPQTTIGYPCPMGASVSLPATWIFRTRENYGVLQITEIIKNPERPNGYGKGIKFRYKLLDSGKKE